MAVAAIAPRSPRVLADDVVEYRLASAPLAFSPAPDVIVAGLAYNGRIPGPLLRVTYGQRVRVRYTSGVDVPTSVHWHGTILPNDMDGVAGITQPPVLKGQEFVYEFAPKPAGTRWYHDHAMHGGAMRGLFGMFIVDDPNDEPYDREFALVFHDVPKWSTVQAAERGVSNVRDMALPGSPEAAMTMPTTGSMHAVKMERMGDEVAYLAHCIDGATYPRTRKLAVKVGDRVRLRILNASPTQTRYVRLAGHRLTVTHADGNRLAQPVEVDTLRIGLAERYDVSFEVGTPGAFLLQGLTGADRPMEQSALLYTEGMENASPLSSPQTLVGADSFTYAKAGGVGERRTLSTLGNRLYPLTLGGGAFGSNRWTIDGKTWPNTPKLAVRRGDDVVVTFTNETDMEHPMHLHGNVFELLETGGTWFARPLYKDVSLVPPNGTATWRFKADTYPGRWLLHCHNDIHALGGMMTEVVYLTS